MINCYRNFLFGLKRLAILSFFFLSFNSFAQVTVTPATGGESICLNPGPSTSDWYTLSDITITETVVSDIQVTGGGSRTFILGFSGTGSFVFDSYLTFEVLSKF